MLLEEELSKEGVDLDLQSKRQRKASFDVRTHDNQQHIDSKVTALIQPSVQRRSTHDLSESGII